MHRTHCVHTRSSALSESAQFVRAARRSTERVSIWRFAISRDRRVIECRTIYFYCYGLLVFGACVHACMHTRTQAFLRLRPSTDEKGWTPTADRPTGATSGSDSALLRKARRADSRARRTPKPATDARISCVVRKLPFIMHVTINNEDNYFINGLHIWPIADERIGLLFHTLAHTPRTH